MYTIRARYNHGADKTVHRNLLFPLLTHDYLDILESRSADQVEDSDSEYESADDDDEILQYKGPMTRARTRDLAAKGPLIQKSLTQRIVSTIFRWKWF